MNTAIEYRDLGLIDYKEAWDYQEALFNTILRIKQGGVKDAPAGTLHHVRLGHL